MFVKKRFIILEKAKTVSKSFVVLYQKLSVDITIMLCMVYIIFFANINSFMVSIFFLS